MVTFTLKQCCSWELGDLLVQEVQEALAAILQSTLLFPEQEERNTAQKGLPLEKTLCANKQLVIAVWETMYANMCHLSETLRIDII